MTDPVAVADIADRLDMTPPAVGNWRARYDDFPLPRFTVARGRCAVWEWADVAAWYAARPWGARTGRPRPIPDQENDR